MAVSFEGRGLPGLGRLGPWSIAKTGKKVAVTLDSLALVEKLEKYQ